MKVASITLPIKDNDGLLTSHAHEYLKDKLLKSFGGYTMISVVGAWRDPVNGVVHKDESIRYEVAGGDRRSNNGELMFVAVQAGILARQKCVYFVCFNGDAIIEDCDGFKPQQVESAAQ